MVARIVFVTLLTLLMSRVEGQSQITIQGKVKDESNQPLSGVAVGVDSVFLTATDVNGRFQLQLKSGTYELSLRAVGFQYYTQQLTFSNDTILTLRLKQDDELLDEVHIHDHQELETQSSVIVSGEELQSTPSGNFAEQLEKIPGVTSINVGVGIGKPVIRGMSFNRVSVYDQGVQQQGQQWGADHGLEIDAFKVNRVEVIKGAQAIQYGSDGIGGVIRLLPEKIPEQDGWNGDFTSAFYSNNLATKNSLKVGVRKGQHYVSVRGTYNRYGDFAVPDESFEYQTYVLPITNQRLKNTGGAEWNLNGFYQYTSENFLLQWTASHFDQQAGFFVGAIGQPQFYDLTDDGNRYNVALPFQYVQHTKSNLRLQWHHENHNDTRINLNYQLNQRREYSFPHAHGYPVDDNDTLALRLNLHTAGLDVKHTFNYSKRFHINVGLQSKVQWNRRFGYEYLIPDYFLHNTGVYSHFTFHISERLTWDGGLRVDVGQTKTDGFQQEVNFGGVDSTWVRTPASDRWFWNFSGATGLALQKKKNTYRFNLGSAFRMPNPAELYANGVHHGTFRHERGNVSLQPENGLQADVSWERASEKWLFSLSPYTYYFFNYLYLKPATTFSPLPDAGQIYSYQQTTAFFAGSEAQIQWQPLQWFKVSTDWSYTYALNVESGYNLPFTPPLQGNGNLTFYQERTAKTLQYWSVEWHQQYSAAQTLTDVNEKTTPQYTLSNLYGKVRFDFRSVDLEVMAGVQNIWNTSYLKHLSRYRLLNISEPGRNFYVSLKLRF